MPILIDGHNLIPHIPGLSLDQIDDEQRLIAMVQDYCRIKRKQAEIIFDQASPGSSGKQSAGMVKVTFARQGISADHMIKDRLARLGKSARNYIVVSSDRSIQLAVRTARARVQSSDEFAQELLFTRLQSRKEKDDSVEPVLGDQEVAEWLRLFKHGEEKNRPK